ncbi:hypothetical protein [Halorhabdus amylolytica]|uniref:hypothetical protein n=1 Tax=Halorhabdus amylolytica TaxID=2559573 RepID=UPI0010AA68D0|nr:hypothetical protein [Halorhabdus amylolytica]
MNDERSRGTSGVLDSWLSATMDVSFAILGWTILLAPVLSIGNRLLGSPLTDSTLGIVLVVLAVGATYPVMIGTVSLGNLGEFLFLAVGSALVWGSVLLLALATVGGSFAGGEPLPAALLLTVAYLSAYVLLCRFDVRVFQ